jgi:hypothetical protein
MTTATLSNAPATQLTFPWALPKAVTDAQAVEPANLIACPASANSFQEEQCQDNMLDERIGKPFRVGAVMFRLLKSYGISDLEIAEGIAQYGNKVASGE